MKILVTGANGYLGQGVIVQLLNLGHDVIAVDLDVENIDNRAKKIKADIFSIENPFYFFEYPDVVLHMAWRNGFIHNSFTHIEDIFKHFIFIKSIINGGAKHIAVLGTMHEIGFWEGSIDENTPTNPLNYYGIAKDALRKIVYLLCKEKNVKYQWIRGFYIVGNTKYGSSVFSKITQAEERKETSFPFTSGQNQWDFLDYDEFCNQVACIVVQDKVDGIINACSGYPEKLADRVERFIKENHYKIKLSYGTFPDRLYDSKAVWGNNKKITEILKNKSLEDKENKE